HLVSLHHFQFWGVTNPATSSVCGIWCPCTISSSGGLPTAQQVLCVAFGVPASFPVPGGYQPRNKFCAFHLVSLHHYQFWGATNRATSSACGIWCPCTISSSGGLPTPQQVLCEAFGVPAPSPVLGGYQPRNKFCALHLVSLHHFQFRGATNRATSSACGIWCPCTISSSGGLPTAQQVLRVAFGVPAPFPVLGGYQPRNKFCVWHLVSLHHVQFRGVTNRVTSSVPSIWCPCTMSSAGGLPTAQQVLCLPFGVPAPFPVPGGYQPRNKFCAFHLVSLHHVQFRGVTNRATSSACGIWCPCTISSSRGLPTAQQVLRVAFGVPAPFPVPGGYQPRNKFCVWHLVSLHHLQFRGDYQLRNKFCAFHLVSLHHFQFWGVTHRVTSSVPSIWCPCPIASSGGLPTGQQVLRVAF